MRVFLLMIKNKHILEELDKQFILGKGRLSHDKALRLFEAMWIEAKNMGIVPLKDPMEGIDVDIRIARILNSCSKTSSRR